MPPPLPRSCRAMPANTPASLALRCVVFQHLMRPPPQNVGRVFLVGCSKNEKWHSHAPWRSLFFVLPMLGGVANSDLFNPSAARMLILGLGDLVLRPPILQLRLRCGALFSNTCTAMPTRFGSQLLRAFSQHDLSQNVSPNVLLSNWRFGSPCRRALSRHNPPQDAPPNLLFSN